MTRLDDLLTQSHSIRASLIAAERKLRDSLALVIEMQDKLRAADVALLVAIQLEQEPRREEGASHDPQ